jgi:hypothetical protein
MSMTLVLILVIALGLFAAAFLSKRRFGTLGLALAAGALLSSQLTRNVSLLLEQNNVPVQPLSFTAAASVGLILLPALVLLLRGPAYKSKTGAIVGSIVFALMATVLILGPLTTALPALEPLVWDALQFIAKYQSLLIAAAVIGAIIDTWLTHNTKSKDKKKHK